MKKSGSWLRKIPCAKVLVLGVLMFGLAQMTGASCENPAVGSDGVDFNADWNHYGGHYAGPNYPNFQAFAVLTADGQIRAWGDDEFGGNQAEVPVGTGFTKIYSNEKAFAALTADGQIRVWGSDEWGGNQAEVPTGTGFAKIYSTEKAFAALTADGQIRVWGDDNFGGNQAEVPTGTGYTTISSTRDAFAALASDGQIRVWGDDGSGGNQAEVPIGAAYIKIYSNYGAFAALTPDGQIKAWGDDFDGGNQAEVPVGSGYTEIYSGTYAFAALTADGQIKVWGHYNYGGSQADAPTGTGYTEVHSSVGAFAALTADGQIKAWGDGLYGGNQADVPSGQGYTKIYSNSSAFAALTADGQIKVWGEEAWGGNQAEAPTGSGYTKIYATESAFATLTSDGQIMSWGGVNQAETPTGSGYTDIYSNTGAFAALTSDGQIRVWGWDESGGNQADAPTGSGYTIPYGGDLCDFNLPPYDLTLTPDNIDENVSAGTEVGTFTTTDEEDDTYTYSFTTGCANSGVDNNAFTITGDKLSINNSPDYETKATYNLCITTNDGTDSFEKEITVNVNDLDEEPPVITLNGANPMTITQGETYTEPGATCTDNVDPTCNVVIAGTVDTNTVGTYTVTYNATDAAGNNAIEQTRTVNVIAGPDTTAPVITLNGDNPMTVNQGDPYIEQGATCVDDVDENCTVIIGGDTVDTSTVGTYYVIYNATDAAGNISEDARTVNVVTGPDTTPPSLAEMAFIPTPTKDTTPNYTFSSTEDGTINYSGDCSSSTTNATAGDNTITFNELTEGFHSNCAITVTDSDGNTSNPLSVTGFIVDLTSPTITLNGDNPTTIVKGATYTEPGATCTDNFDPSCTVTIGGDVVNTNTPGTYTVTYNATDRAGNSAEEKTRTVKVLAEADTTPPIITLNGDNPMTITQGETYTEPGATCTDNVDTNCTVTIAGTVDTNTPGTYTITYNAQDSSGNHAEEKTRTVKVIAEEEMTLSPIYRFWSDTQQAHFYTISEQEKDHVIKTYPDNVWRYEGLAYKASKTKTDTTYPIYRFWSDTQQAHFYTISEQEKDHVIKTYPDNVWRYEGIAWYSEKEKNDENQPLHRFWSDTQKAHFYTISEQEKDHVIKTYSDNVWRYEGIAWYGRK